MPGFMQVSVAVALLFAILSVVGHAEAAGLCGIVAVA